MLDDVTKRRINTLRQILVGKLPDPKAQVEQITNGLIYKFMNDMDEQSVSMGGKATYFSGKFQKYSWKNLMDTKTSGFEKVTLYSEAIEQMFNNENLPELFREMFKNSFLPFKDPSTLNMFLKGISEFNYSHSEKLGDAFEYLLSFMGSQGDAGQFRTPRHIIDFIVEIVNPQKNETILDPACGTAGFLISSYRHILKQNTKKNLGDSLNTSDRKKIGENLNGYDISPDMVKMSLVNMYLHKFTSPNISEYDTLSSEDKWNEYYDVILANPPFFSPKGGITPHNRFGVKSTKAEVLFIDYINEHLTPNGRAGIIVPEGIIFQTGTAYKQLRKKLIETSLIGVVSLPAGIFQPYTGVKTSILILDQSFSKEIDNIFFKEIQNDGFSLNVQRSKIEGSQLQDTIKSINIFFDKRTTKDLITIKKIDILNNQNFSFNFNSFIKNENNLIDNNFILLKDLSIISNGYAFESKNYIDNGHRIIRITNVQKGKILDTNPKFHSILKKKEEHKKFNLEINDILISLTGNVGRVGKISQNMLPAYLNQRVAKIKAKDTEKINNDFLFHILNSNKFEHDAISNSYGVAQKNLSTNWISNYKIPLPSIETQNQIVEELDSYQKIIDGCRQVIENYKPSIDIDPSWEMIELDDLCDIKGGGTPSRNNNSYWSNGKIKWLSCKHLDEKGNVISFEAITEKGLKSSSSNIIKSGSVIVVNRVSLGKVVFTNEDYAINQDLTGIDTKDSKKISNYFIFLFLTKIKQKFIDEGRGLGVKGVTRDFIKKIKTPVPPIFAQNKIIDEIKTELKIIEENKKMILKFENKINNKINSILSI